jgi:hypothetical protein
MKVLAMTIAAGAALCSLMAVPASAIPMSDLAAAASDLALDQSVRSTRQYQRYRVRGSGTITAMEQTAPATATDQTPPAIRKAGWWPDACSNGYWR